MDQKIYFYNTASRKKEEFKPIVENRAGMYSCGPTVYWNQHIGNMYAFIFDDLIVRTLRYLGYEVKWVMNITDVGHLTSDADEGEDKMEKGARREGISAWEVAKKYEKQFLESLDLLNVERPDVISKATDHIQEQIDLIKKIEKNGFTYRTSDGIYYDTSKFPGYGDFAHLDLEKIKEGARVEANPEKKNPSDFALWKFSPKDGTKRQMEWDSPWGVGFPGWHIECTAMSTKYLGETFDIHTGGEDHIAIHHTNEIAQGFAAFGHQTANVWMHNAFITVKGGKMSKSSGKIMTVQELQEKGYKPLAYRLMAISSHYKKGIDFSFEGLEAAQNALEKLTAAVAKWKNAGVGQINEEFKKEFVAAISNDLAMAEAMAIVWKLVKSDIPDADKLATILDFDRVMGLSLAKAEAETEEVVPFEIQKLAKARLQARENKDWAESDRIRDLIKEKGYVIEDTQKGSKIRRL